MASRPPASFPPPLPSRYARLVTHALRAETVGGALMLGATLLALVWANSPWAGAYQALRETRVGPEFLHLHLSLQTWAADGLLALFFFVAGIEVKHEIVHGDLRHPRNAVLPVVAAVTGMIVPAGLYLTLSAGAPGALAGWAVPIATDIAFALAVLVVAAPGMPTALRAFLLTLAIVDDLGAIVIIALFYTETFHLGPLLGAVALLGLYAYLQHRRVRLAALYIVLALVTWALVHASGVHATIAGAALGLLTRAVTDREQEETPAERAEHWLDPLSSRVAVPLFAFLAAGVSLTPDTLSTVFSDRVTLGVVVGLVAGKFLGVFGGAWLSVRLGFAMLAPEVNWRHLAGISMLAGIGFTVSLLIAELAYGGTPRIEHVKASVLIASVIASLLAAGLLRAGSRAEWQRAGRRSPSPGV